MLGNPGPSIDCLIYSLHLAGASPNILFNVVQDLFTIQLYTWPCFFLNMTFIILELLACMLQAVVMSSLIAIYLDHSIRFVH